MDEYSNYYMNKYFIREKYFEYGCIHILIMDTYLIYHMDKYLKYYMDKHYTSTTGWMARTWGGNRTCSLM